MLKKQIASLFIAWLFVAMPFSLAASTKPVKQSVEVPEFMLNDAEAPAMVQNLRATEVRFNKVTLEWDASQEADLDHYNIYKNGQLLTTTTETTFSDNEVAASTPYIYAVSAVDTSNNEGGKAQASVVTAQSPYPAISAVQATPKALSAIITWLTDIPSDSKVEFGTTKALGASMEDGNYVTQHEITLTGLQSDTTYYFRAVSCNATYCSNSSTQNFTVPHYTPLFLNVTLPPYYNKISMPVRGTTTKGTKVSVRVNGRVSSSTTVGIDGKFNLAARALSTTSPNKIIVDAIDEAGAQMNKSFTVQVDVEPPELKVEPIPKYSVGDSVSVKGSVSEASTVEVFITPQSWKASPPGPESFTAFYAARKVHLEWNASKEEDFRDFILYRDDAPIAVLTTNTYEDSKIVTNTGKTFSYAIVERDKLCQTSEKKSLTVDVPAMQGSENYNAPAVDDSCSAEPAASKKDTTVFNMQAGIGPGVNEILVRATDIAGNTDEYSTKTTYDSGPPQILWTNIPDISPSYTKDVVIRGNVSEPAKIVIKVNDNKEYETETKEASIDGSTYYVFEKEITLDANEQFLVETTDGNRVQVREGNEVIDEIKNGGTPEIAGTFGAYGSSYANKLTLTAIDKAGLNETKTYSNVLYSTCGQGNWFTVDVVPGAGLMPATIIPRHIIEGIASVNLPLVINWSAGEPKGTISSITASFFPVSREDAENWDRDWAAKPQFLWDRRSGVTETSGVLTVKLKKQDPQDPNGGNWTMFQKEDYLSKHNSGKCSFSSAINRNLGTKVEYGCVRLPVELTIRFQDPSYEQQARQQIIGQPVRSQRVQKQCIELEVPIDRRVNFGDINKGWLNTGITVLNASVAVANATYYAAYYARLGAMAACWLTWIGGYGLYGTIDRFASCWRITPEDEYKAMQGDCTDATDLSKCESCAGYYGRMASLKNFANNVCDRVYCPSVPTIEKYVKDKNVHNSENYFNNDLDKPLSSCSGLKPEDVKKIKPATLKPVHQIKSNAGNCLYEYNRDFKPACPTVTPTDVYKEITGNTVTSTFGKITRTLATASARMCGKKGEGDYEDIVEIPAVKLKQGNIGKLITDSQQTGGSEYWLLDGGALFAWYSITGKTVTLKFGVIAQGSKVKPAKGNIQVTDENTFIPVKDAEVHFSLSSYDPGKGEYEGFTKDNFKTLIKSFTGNGNGQLFKFDGTFSYNIWYNKLVSAIGRTPRDYIIDPTANFASSLSCLCFSSLEQYLLQFRNMLLMTRDCLATLRDTGDGEAGVCQALLSQYMCDLLWDTFDCARGLVGAGSGATLKAPGSGLLGGVKAFFQSITRVGDQIRRGIGNRYQGRNMFDAYFNTRTLGHGMCIFAFTGTWPINYDMLIQPEIPPMDVDSKVMVMPAERRFVRYIPFGKYAGLTDWVYHFGIWMQAGADINYKVQLVCSADYSCDGKPCDCAQLGQEQTRNIALSPPANGLLRRGQILNQEEYATVTSAPYRYDKIRVTWDWYATATGKKHHGSYEKKISETMPAPPFCQFNVLSGTYRCDIQAAGEDYAKFVTVPTPEKTTFYVGEPINFNVIVAKAVPDQLDEECYTGACESTTWLTVDILNEQKKPIYPQYRNDPATKTAINGEQRFSTSTFPGIPLQKEWFNPEYATQIDFHSSTNDAPTALDYSNAQPGDFVVYFVDEEKYAILDAEYSQGKFSLQYTKDGTVNPTQTVYSSAWNEEIISKVMQQQGKTDQLLSGTALTVKGVIITWSGKPKKGAWFAFHKATPVQTKGDFCDGKPKTFYAKFTLYKPDPNDPERPGSTPVAGQAPEGAQTAENGGVLVPFYGVCDNQNRGTCPEGETLDSPSQDGCMCGSQRYTYEFVQNELIKARCLPYTMHSGTEGVLLVKEKGIRQSTDKIPLSYPKKCSVGDKNGLTNAVCFCTNGKGKHSSPVKPSVKYNDICNEQRPYCGADGYCYKNQQEYEDSICPRTFPGTGCVASGSCPPSGKNGLVQKSDVSCPSGKVCCITQCESSAASSGKTYGDQSGNVYCVSDKKKCKKADNWVDNSCPDDDSKRYGCCELK